MTFSPDLARHLSGGATTVARAIAVRRSDGTELGFTDHDRDMSFEGVRFRANSGFTAKALSQSTGLAVDNTEVFGALRSDAITEVDLRAGRYDGAEVRVWLVNWADAEMRTLVFRGTIGEVTASGGAFTAELRGLSEALNRPMGRIYHARCSAVLGDRACRFDLSQPGYSVTGPVEAGSDARVFRLAGPLAQDARWFEKGRLVVTSGDALGLSGVVKADGPADDGGRIIELWEPLGIRPQPGDQIRIEAGCDKRAETCRLKFSNFMNFRGFPHIPGEDWLMSYPVSGGANDGGSLRR